MKSSNQNRNINIVTLGCSKNIVDSEKLLRQIKAGGFSVTYDPASHTADTVIINTCGFINDAREESVNTILSYIGDVQSGRVRNLYVMGCLSERYMDALENEIPEVKKYFGVNNIDDILKELSVSPRQDLLTERILTGPGHYAYLKVSEGCDRKCAFCAIPAIRGKYVSRPTGELLAEARNLAFLGVKELILVAQDLSYYGLDLYRKQMLPELVKSLLGMKSFEWIRIHYLYPANFPMELIPLMKDNPQICSYIDIPIQHISDKILGMMRRSHGEKETRDLLYNIRHELPGAVIRTTLIVGHPGETRKEFNRLRDFVSEFRFDRLGVFAYSHEEGTFAGDNYADEIPAKDKESRVAELMEIQQSISYELNNARKGNVLKVIIYRSEGDYFIGRTEFDSPEVDQEVLINKQNDLKEGNFYNILITGATEFDLFGVPVADEDNRHRNA
ncbi:MAG: 30S ribosomal protein S12 methylthiotransferase RimO [Bacteroidales bacterium]